MLVDCTHTNICRNAFTNRANPFTPQGETEKQSALASLQESLSAWLHIAVDFFILLLQRASYWIQLQIYKTVLLYYLFITIDQNTYSQSVYLSREAHWIPCWVMLFFSLSLCFLKQARLSYTFSLVQTVWIVCVCVCACASACERERESVLFLAGRGSLGSQAYGKSALGKSWTQAFHYAVLLKHTQTYKLAFVTQEVTPLTFTRQTKP